MPAWCQWPGAKVLPPGITQICVCPIVQACRRWSGVVCCRRAACPCACKGAARLCAVRALPAACCKPAR
eukprot:5847711-Alexandrium_andersonii.AAC.1